MAEAVEKEDGRKGRDTNVCAPQYWRRIDAPSKLQHLMAYFVILFYGSSCRLYMCDQIITPA